MPKHTILIGGDDGQVYRITTDDLKGHEVERMIQDWHDLDCSVRCFQIDGDLGYSPAHRLEA